MPLSLVTSAG